MRLVWKRKAAIRRLTYLVSCCAVILLVKNHYGTNDHVYTERYSEESEIAEKLEITVEAYKRRMSRFDNYQRTEAQRSGPGEQGRGVQLSPEENKNLEDVFKLEAFNKIASDKIALDRALSDIRLAECRIIRYDEDLPTLSVVIIFHNEAWSPVLRTVHSAINRTPPRYLKEIILLDDASTRSEMLHPLDKYIKEVWPDGIVKVVRMPNRIGLIRARLEGARAATGDVLLFLDAHCEAAKGWAEPLLQRIKEDRRAVLCPSIGSISSEDMWYNSGSINSIGSFWWGLHFTWEAIPEREIKRRKNITDPIRSPTMAGGLFAVERNYFFEIGGYDEGMEIWGGENLEISFRIWMCGGSIEFIPCSNVGHIFRASHPYGFPGKKDYHGINSKRLAEVWMDEYKRLFYMHRTDLITKEYGNVSSRHELRQRLKCHSFKWYLDNVIPQKFIPDENVQAYGYVRNPETNLCLDLINQNEFDRGFLTAKLYACQGGYSGGQLFSLSLEGRLRREWGCVRPDEKDEILYFRTCADSANELWQHSQNKGQLLHLKSGKCMDASGLSNYQPAQLHPCSQAASQIWNFEHYIN